MLNRFLFVFFICLVSNVFSNNFYETFGQTNAFSLKAGNHVDPNAVVYKKSFQSKHNPSISVIKNNTNLTMVKLNISNSLRDNFSFTVYDIRGRSVYSKKGVVFDQMVIKFKLVSGNYILCLRSAKNIITHKLFVN